MPPRKRKAPAKLQAIAESPVKDEEEAVQQPEVNAPTDLLRQIDDQVAEQANDLLVEASKLAAQIRDEGPLACLRIPKKVREMSVADFFGLSEEEAAATSLHGLLARLRQMTGATAPPQATEAPGAAAPVSTLAANSTAAAGVAVPSTSTAAIEAPPTRVTRRTAARTGVAPAAPLPPPTTSTRRTRAATQQASQTAPAAQAPIPASSQADGQQAATGDQEGIAAGGNQAGTSKASNTDDAAAAALMPPPPPPPLARRGLKTATAAAPPAPESAAASPHAAQHDPQGAPFHNSSHDQQQQQPGAGSVMATPAHGGTAAAATPVAGGGVSGVLATAATAAANMMSTAMRSMPGGTSLMAGFTLMKRTVARGRTRGARTATGGRDENAIMISTADGKQFLIDEGVGLACVPEAYRKEVASQLEVLQRLAAAALNRR